MTATTVWVVPHMHWDREWYLPFQTFRARLVDAVDQVVELVETEPDFAFTLDGQLATLDDYLEIRPEAEPRVRTALQQGRLAVGPWQTLMDEFCVSGETIVRNLQRGIARAAELGTQAMTVGYLPDMFGHIAQMPQILRRAGVEHAVVWRGVPAAITNHRFTWSAPDGSSVATELLVGGYGNAVMLFALPDRVDQKVTALHRQLDGFFGDDDLLAMVGADHTSPERAVTSLSNAVNAAQSAYRLRVATLDDYIHSTNGDEPRLRWGGEMRSGARANILMGVLSLRRDAKAACGLAERLLERYAEPLAALYLPTGAASERLIELAWERLIANAAHDSACHCSADATVAQVMVRYLEAQQLARAVADTAMATCAAGVSGFDHVVLNPSAQQRADVVELDLIVPPDWEAVSLRTAGADVIATQELERTAPVLLAETHRGRDALAIFDRMFGRVLFGRQLNRVHAARIQGRHHLIFEVDDHPDPEMLDVDEVRGQAEVAVAVAPDEDWELRVVGRPRRRVLARVPAPPLGATTVTALECAAEQHGPVRADGTTLHNGLLEVGVEDDGTLRLTAGGQTLRRAGRIVDMGDCGDSYNWGPVAHDTPVDTPTWVSARVVERGPVRAVVAVDRSYQWPVGLRDAGSRRSDETADVTLTTTVELHAGEPFARIRITFTNPAQDHRVRWHMPLPARVERSWAEGQFAVVERGLSAEGGHGEHPLPTFPATGFVAVEGLAVLLNHLTEYELVDNGSELAVALLRATGMISRNLHPLRREPAGPEIPIPDAQMIGPQEISFALLPFAGAWYDAGVVAAAERYRHPFLTRPGAGGQAPGATPVGLRVEGPNAVLSSLRRRDEWLELRLVCEQDVPAECTVSGGISAARAVDLLGRPAGELTVDDGALRLRLQPWEIRTVQLRRHT